MSDDKFFHSLLAREFITGRLITNCDLKLSNQMQFEILTPMDALNNGYLSLTTPYRQEYEHEMQWMTNVLRDMEGCDAVIIDTGKGYEVARHKSELILAEPR